MNRRAVLFACVLFLAPGCTTSDAGPSAAEQRARASEGHALLDDYVGLFKASTMAGNVDAFVEALAEHEERARKLEDAGKLDAAFRDRHRRLVDVTRVFVAPNGDAETRRRHVEQLDAFVRAVAGPDAARVDPNGGLAAIAPLVLDEVLSLHMLLDGETDRQKARSKYLGSLGAP